MQVTAQVTEQMKHDLATDGAIAVRGLFSPRQLARVRECLDYGMAHPSTMAGRVYAGTDDEDVNDYGNPGNREHYLPVLDEPGLGPFVASPWNSEHVWFLGEELFRKNALEIVRGSHLVIESIVQPHLVIRGTTARPRVGQHGVL